VWWPDINIPDENDQSQIADRQASALMKYVTGGGYQVIPPLHFLTMVLRFTRDQALTIIEALKLPDNPKIVPPAVSQAEAKAAMLKASGNTTAVAA
jgi:hypothetical protein